MASTSLIDPQALDDSSPLSDDVDSSTQPKRTLLTRIGAKGVGAMAGAVTTSLLSEFDSFRFPYEKSRLPGRSDDTKRMTIGGKRPCPVPSSFVGHSASAQNWDSSFNASVTPQFESSRCL
jgi:hypothetical protein